MIDAADGSSHETDDRAARPRRKNEHAPSEGPPTEGVRISALEASVAAGLTPSTSRAPSEPSGGEATVALPDWTEPATGQVPRVLLDEQSELSDDDLLAGLRGPTWREHGSDWEDDTLDLSFLSEDGPDPRIATTEMVGDDVPLDLAFEDLDVPCAPAPRAYVAHEASFDPAADLHAGQAPFAWPSAHEPPPSFASVADDPGDVLDGDDEIDDAAWAALLAQGGEHTERREIDAELEEGPRVRRRRSETRRGAHLARAPLAKAVSPEAPIDASSPIVAAAAGVAAADAVTSFASSRAARRRGSRGAARAGASAGSSARSANGRHSSGSPRRSASALKAPMRATGAPTRRDPVLATITGVIAGAVGLGAFLAGAQTSIVLAAILIAVAAGELLGTLRRAGHHPATPLALLAAPALVVGGYLRGAAAWPLVLGLAMVLSMVWFLVAARGERPATDLGVTLLAIFWVGGLGSFAGLLLAPGSFPHRHGVVFLAGAVALTVASDVGAYAVGARWGRHLLAPTVSPSKSVEGLVAGVVLTLLVAALGLSHLHPLDLPKALAFGVAAAVLAPLGDLAESLVKRDIGVKDMGSVLPAHGGVLDRVDGMLFVLPAIYFLVEAFHLS